MRKIIILFFAILICHISVSQQKFIVTIILKKAVDKRELIYDENKLFKEYGVFTKECLLGGYTMDINGYQKKVDYDPIISFETPIDETITKSVYEALVFCDFRVLEPSSNVKANSLEIEINKLFSTYTSVNYAIKIFIKSINNEILLEKTFYHCIYFDNFLFKGYFSSSKNIIKYCSQRLYNQLIIFFQSETFIESYNGRKKIFKYFILQQPINIKQVNDINLKDIASDDVTCMFLPNSDIIKDLQSINNYKNIYDLSIPINYMSKNINLDNLNNLEFLNLSCFQFLKNIDTISSLKNLIYLSLAYNYKIENYKIINNLEKLKYLEIESSFLKKIEIFDNLKDLIVLNLKFNEIKKIENLENFNNLKCLNLNYNSIYKIEELGNQKNLSNLILSVNKISKIENIDHLINLKELNLADNSIAKIENIEKLTNLKKLYLGGNPITKIQNLNKLINLNELSFCNTKIRKIENLEDLVNLQSLDLSKNISINKLENLDNLIKLEVLDLSGTSIKEIENINKLINLKELNLSETNINKLNNIENLKKLKILDISKTKIKSLKVIENLPELTILDITNSKIDRLESIEKCPKLSRIKADDLQIDEISRASYEYLKKNDWIFFGNLTIDEFIKKYLIKVID